MMPLAFTPQQPKPPTVSSNYKKMTIAEADYHSIFRKEGEILYYDLSKLNQNRFNDWIVNNFKEIQTISSFKKVAPSRKCLNSFLSKGYKHIESQCHYSAKAISLINPSYEYFTGFIFRQNPLNRIVTHSFNVFANSIVDFARIDKNLEVLNIEEPCFPHIYYGIKIPYDFLKQFEKETFNEFSMKPLLYEWYIENNCC